MVAVEISKRMVNNIEMVTVICECPYLCEMVLLLVTTSKLLLSLLSQVTAEDESGIHIWDLRKPKSPVKELPGHTHW